MRYTDILTELRRRAGMRVIDIGPLVGMSPAWGQRILDGSIRPRLHQVDVIARTLGATERERVDMLEDISQRVLRDAGLHEEQVEDILPHLRKLFSD